jgi:hypothetical protein
MDGKTDKPAAESRSGAPVGQKRAWATPRIIVSQMAGTRAAGTGSDTTGGMPASGS